DRNPQGLEYAPGGMPTFPACRCRYGIFYEIYQLSCRFNRTLLTFLSNAPGDLFGKFFFTILKENLHKFFIRPFIDDRFGSQGRPLIHPHIKRRIMMITKSPLSFIELGGRNT